MNIPNLQGRKILIADDSSSSLLLLNAFLEPTGALVLEAKNGLKVLELFSQHPDIDLIVLDIFMPELDGIETVKRIREINKTLPVIAQTAFVTKVDEERCLSAGFSAYLAKPIDLNLFYDTLWHFLG